MIDFINQTPSAYSESRDYQIISKLFDAAIGSAKGYSDLVYPAIQDKMFGLGELKCINQNFVPKLHWEDSVLNEISRTFKLIMRYKGTLTAIIYVINCLLKALGLVLNRAPDILVTSRESFEKEESFINKGSSLSTYYIYIGIPKSTILSGLIRDLFRYILPIGVNYRIIELQSLGEELITDMSISTNNGASHFGVDSEWFFIEDKNLKIADKSYDQVNKEGIKIFDNSKNVWVRLNDGTLTNMNNNKEITRDLPGNQIYFNKVIKNADDYQYEEI